jgi:hypothetical protein
VRKNIEYKRDSNRAEIFPHLGNEIMVFEEKYNPIHEAFVEELKKQGLSEHLDLAAIRSIAKPHILESVKSRTLADERGQGFASYIFSFPIPKGVLPIVMVGGAHIPVIAENADKKRFKPLITGSTTAENLQKNKARYVESDDTFGQYGLANILGTAAFYNHEEKEFKGTKPIILVGDTHGTEYDLSLPSPEALRRFEIHTVLVFLEGFSQGSVNFQDLRVGDSGFGQLIEMLFQYRKKGLSLEINGLELDKGEDDERTMELPSFTSEAMETHASRNWDAVTWEELAREQAMDVTKISNPQAWLEEQIKFYENSNWHPTADGFRIVLKNLLKGKAGHLQ